MSNYKGRQRSVGIFIIQFFNDCYVSDWSVWVKSVCMHFSERLILFLRKIDQNYDKCVA